MLLCHTTYGLICGMRRDQAGMKWDGVSRNRANYYRDFSDSERALNLSGSPSNRSGDLDGQFSGDACSPLKYESREPTLWPCCVAKAAYQEPRAAYATP